MYITRKLPNTRIDVADALRGIAAAGIILYHSVEHFSMVITQYLFARFWFSSHQRGPLESLWRKLTWIGEK